jgi:hypothetical protein
MRTFALMMASVAGLGLATPAFASDNSAARVQLAQAGISVNVGTPGVVVRDRHYRHRHHNRYHSRHWHGHRAQGDVVVVKKRKPARKTVIIER